MLTNIFINIKYLVNSKLINPKKIRDKQTIEIV